ncbi:type 1 glutamine amidotransferase [Brevibacillus porteri]|uniref:type 1 glutamine amidotransferase n=1 Tax=Brevibacillus porteri TaxID=2126350 RepID=UPI00364504A5
MKIHYLQNNSVCDLGNIKEWIAKKEHVVTGSHLFNGERVPDHDDFDLLIILGGNPEESTWLEEEIAFIRKSIENKKYMLGICLGSQLIAESMGGKLVPHTHKEIGWWSVQIAKDAIQHPLLKNVPDQLEVFCYHKNTFLMPEQFVWSGESEGCKNQIYLYKDHVIAVQFHPEFTENTLRQIEEKFRENPETGPYIQPPEHWFKHEANLKGAKHFIHSVLDNLENKIKNNV